MTSAASVLQFMEEHGANWIDVRFVDVPGTWQHFSFPKHEVNDDMFSHGVGFDGSSIRVFQTIDESDMLLVPDPNTVALDPYMDRTVSIIADVRDPSTGEDYHRQSEARSGAGRELSEIKRHRGCFILGTRARVLRL